MADYWHVIDEDNGEHVATYTDRAAAYQRSTHEALTNGRDFCTVTTSIPTVTLETAI